LRDCEFKSVFGFYKTTLQFFFSYDDKDQFTYNQLASKARYKTIFFHPLEKTSFNLKTRLKMPLGVRYLGTAVGWPQKGIFKKVARQSFSTKLRTAFFGSSADSSAGGDFSSSNFVLLRFSARRRPARWSSASARWCRSEATSAARTSGVPEGSFLKVG
jgi:hypothetical protein